jgi:hypothetical protein
VVVAGLLLGTSSIIDLPSLFCDEDGNYLFIFSLSIIYFPSSHFSFLSLYVFHIITLTQNIHNNKKKGVYGPLFNAGGTHIRIECDYPHIFKWMKHCWNDVPGVKESVDLTDACESYYRQLFPLNPSGIVPSPSITSKSLNLD